MKSTRPSIVFAAVCLVLTIVFGNLLGSRALLEVSGTVTARHESHARSGMWIHYAVATAGGAVDVRTDGVWGIAGNLPVGTHLEKHRWELGYRVNGREVDDFPRGNSAAYVVPILIMGAVALLLARAGL